MVLRRLSPRLVEQPARSYLAAFSPWPRAFNQRENCWLSVSLLPFLLLGLS
jgi:hypothetical protein